MNYSMIFIVLLVAIVVGLGWHVRRRNRELLKHLRKQTPYVDVKPPGNIKNL